MHKRHLALRNLLRGNEEYLQIHIRKLETIGSQQYMPLKAGTTFREAPILAWSAESVSSVLTGVGCAVLISLIDSAPHVAGVHAPEVLRYYSTLSQHRAP
jgi:hypothetical protein